MISGVTLVLGLVYSSFLNTSLTLLLDSLNSSATCFKHGSLPFGRDLSAMIGRDDHRYLVEVIPQVLS